jgi:cytidine deaminase
VSEDDPFSSPEAWVADALLPRAHPAHPRPHSFRVHARYIARHPNFRTIRSHADVSSPNLDLDPGTARGLLDRAREARAHAYAPYSRFPVGAALLAADGRVFTGCNVENASYGLANCAERVAIGKAVSEGARAFAAIAVIGPEDVEPCAPCGACRQVLYEFGPELPVIFPAAEGEGGYQVRTMDELLPGAFGPARLAESQRARGV